MPSPQQQAAQEPGAWAIKGFGGMIPRTESRMLPDSMAEEAVNCDLSSGVLEGLPVPELVRDLSAVSGTVRRAYRFPGPNSGDPDVWLALPSEFSSVCRSPLADDTSHRLYWTNPGDGPFWSTYVMIAANTPPYALGIVQPSTTVGPTVVAAGGTLDGSVPEIVRSYCYTYVNAYGEESAPSYPSASITGAPDGTWTITGVPTAAPSNPSGVNYAPVVGLNLYRTSTGTQTGAQFYRVASWVFSTSPPPYSYSDLVPDTTAVNNLALYSTSFANPPAGLDGLTALPGGMLVGFTDNTLHFCEPDRPHAWPAAYDQSVQYKIVGLGVWQQSLVVLTQGYPSTGSGNSPTNFVLTQIRVPEPCVSRGSIITDLMGVYYASQNGLVMLNYFGMQNQTLSTVTKNIWLNDYKAASIIACRHRAQYLAINGTGTGFLIDYSEQRMGFMNLNTFNSAVCVWNDEYSGDAYVIANKVVYRWDSPNTGPLNYRWRSKQFYGAAPLSLGACQISLDPAVSVPIGISAAPPMDNGDTTLELPGGVNAVFNLYAGPDGAYKIMTRNLTKPREIFRLPSGFKSFDWQFEIVARVGVRSIEVGPTMRSLRGV